LPSVESGLSRGDETKMRPTLAIFIGALSFLGLACDSGELKEDRTIERVPVPESRFKPVALELTIDGLVAEVEAQGAEEIPLGIILKDLFGFWRPVAVGANRAISELEIPGAVQGATTELPMDERAPQQIGFVEQQHELNYAGLGLAPHNDTLAPSVDQWVDEGRHVVTIDTDLPESRRQLYIGTDNAQAGATAGQTLIDLLDGATGRVIVLGNTDPTWIDGVTRTNTAADVLREAGNEVKVVHSMWAPDGVDADLMLTAIQGEVNDLPLVGLLGVFANAHACATAALAAELTEMPKIVTFDFEPQTLDYMENGTVHATHAQRQYYMGYLSVYVLYGINLLGIESTKEHLGDHLLRGFHLDTGLDVIHSDELEEWNSFVDELGIE